MRRVARFTLIVLALFLAAELVLRLFGYGSYITYQPDQQLMWVPRPSQKGLTVEGHLPITINDWGYRHTSDIPAADPEEFRIFSFGDSVTMGWGVDDSSHYSAVLEELLSEDLGPGKVRVISAGVNAYPLSLGVERLESVTRAGRQMDLAILAYSFNESFGGVTELRGEERDSFLKKVRIKGFVRKFATYNLLIEDWLRNAVYYRLRGRLIAGSWSTEGKRKTRKESDQKTYLATLEEARIHAEATDTKLVLLLLGSKDQHKKLRSFQRTFLEYANDHDIPLVNMVDLLRDLDHEELYMDHVHPTAKGHRAIAEALVSEVGSLAFSEPD